MNYIKSIGCILGVIIIILYYFSITNELEWTLGILLIWGYIYSIKD